MQEEGEEGARRAKLETNHLEELEAELIGGEPLSQHLEAALIPQLLVPGGALSSVALMSQLEPLRARDEGRGREWQSGGLCLALEADSHQSPRLRV